MKVFNLIGLISAISLIIYFIFYKGKLSTKVYIKYLYLEIKFKI